MDRLAPLGPVNYLARLSAKEVVDELNLRQLAFSNNDACHPSIHDDASNRRELLAVLQKEYDCALEGWMDVQTLSSVELQRQVDHLLLAVCGYILSCFVILIVA